MTGTTRAVTQEPGSPTLDWRRGVLLVAGSGLLIATGAMHLDLYLTGYRTIPTIGWLFLLQIITAFAPRPGRTGAGLSCGLRAAGWLPWAGALFALSVLGGYILSVWIGLFGFKEVRTTAGIVAGIIEVAAFAALAAYALIPAPARDGGQAEERLFARLPAATIKAAGLGAAGLAVLALVLFGVSVAGAGGGSQPGRRERRRGPEDHDDRRRDGADQRQGPHALLVRTRHPDDVEMLRQLRPVLAPGHRDRRRGTPA